MRQLPSLNMLRVFKEVARHRAFSRAAESLNVTQGAASRQIKHLEDYLGVTLFVRTPRGLSITESGSALSDVQIDSLHSEILAGSKRGIAGASGTHRRHRRTVNKCHIRKRELWQAGRTHDRYRSLFYR